MIKEVYEEIMTEAGLWEESGTEHEDVRELGVSEGLLLAAEIVKKAMKDNGSLEETREDEDWR